MPGTLCVVSPGALASADGGRVEIDPKTVDGLVRYAETWPGDVVFLGRSAAAPDPRAQRFSWPRAGDLPFHVELVDEVVDAVARLRPAVTLASLEVESAGLVDQPAPCVWVVDYPLRVRWDNARMDPGLGWVGRARTAAGLTRRSARLRGLLGRGAGVQCNGPDSYATYAPLSANPLLFLDTRVRAADVDAATRLPRADPDRLRLAFSGRWIRQKGVLDAVEAVRVLQGRGVPCELSLMGGGPLEAELEAAAGRGVSLVGRLPFAQSWVPTVREQVDVMVLPHPQGDSASTFLEAISCGAPVAGYPNRYWTAFQAMHGGGWVAARPCAEALADVVEGLADAPARIDDARARGLAFAARHTFEAEFGRRVDHLREVAQR